MWEQILRLTETGQQCVYCNREIPKGPKKTCRYCFKEEELLRSKNVFFGGVIHLYRYEGIMRTLMHNLKYNDQPRLSLYIAQQMSQLYKDIQLSADAISFVPVHQQRLRERGFDQSELIASQMSIHLGIPLAPIFERIKNTTPQFELGREMRAQNMQDAFQLKAQQNDTKDQTILLIDDICTSGATLKECMKCAPDRATILPFVFCHEH